VTAVAAARIPAPSPISAHSISIIISWLLTTPIVFYFLVATTFSTSAGFHTNLSLLQLTVHYPVATNYRILIERSPERSSSTYCGVGRDFDKFPDKGSIRAKRVRAVRMRTQ
jgi:hypothetical protein